MEQRLREVLSGEESNYLNPFFWQNGAGLEVIREEIAAIHDSGIREMCVESRTHPDFLGEGWWETMDVILEEAGKRGMRVWILDDAHFPTGYANGKVAENPYARKRYLDCYHIDVTGPLKDNSFLIYLEPGEEFIAATIGRKGDEAHRLSEVRDITDSAREGMLHLDIPEGTWTVNVIKVTDKSTGRKGYINTIDREAVGLLIQTVYEAHYEKYRERFGKELAGFFSDEPEIGNVLSEYGHNAKIGIPNETLPWCKELETRLREVYDKQYAVCLTGLWAEIEGVSPRARHDFMDIVTDLYGKNFAGQIGDWCRARNVEYIGHVIEDNGCHSRLGLGTGHFFKALKGQDMSGIDVVLQQIRPGLNDCWFYLTGGRGLYDGRFFHYGLAKMGVSLAQLDKNKKGRTMCEIFGAYGWAEGLKLMKWLADHMMVRGVNYFVPHAFSMKDFPDRDCPPHFYAHGLNPQYPYFRNLCQYMNRVSHLIQGGVSVPSVAVLYHACAEWMGDCDGFEVPGASLMRHQIDYEVLPEEALLSADCSDGRLCIGDRQYGALLIPRCEYLPDKILNWCDKALETGLPIYIGQQAPGYEDGQRFYQNPKMEIVADWDSLMGEKVIGEITLRGEFPDLRYYHYKHSEGEYFLFFNESEREAVDTVVTLPVADTQIYRYDAFGNRLYRTVSVEDGVRLRLVPGEATIYYVGDVEGISLQEEYYDRKEIYVLPEDWSVKLIPYDAAPERKLPHLDKLVNLTGPGKEPQFSGRMVYETEFDGGAVKNLVNGETSSLFLDCGKVFETMEVWLNGKSLGVRIAAPYILSLQFRDILPGKNRLRIEVVNTLVHAARDYMSATMPVEPSGLLGPVRILAAD